MVSGKLVRDLIPQIIRASGVEPMAYVVDPEEYRERLRHKLSEEVNEFLSADNSTAAEELADVLEVVHALALDLGITLDRLEELRAQKAEERGGFAGRVVWTGNA
ncbi:nucleoside triphosphate pyrophosphohydrolase [Streptomyces sp. JV184]|uniref:nucleoside triphosphate pyrophosphohydrolase n=1 Tax=Streptomyces sp. JV184 TaxID=858637 RepID=UPI002E768E20|nr:nucleoside triphosphate pyrophosphohydrolase [Streptomyces sp. JV184]MEE1748724.1 nucleoside triphosphate pyrophosphohydrolase [Streptomyces sp. JV184]